MAQHKLAEKLTSTYRTSFGKLSSVIDFQQMRTTDKQKLSLDNSVTFETPDLSSYAINEKAYKLRQSRASVLKQ
jgi:hypothetical protein